MGNFAAVAGMPTATKDSGAEWYYPAVTCEFGRPRRLPHGDRHETRGKAKAEAKRMIKEAANGGTQ
jgi:hypothetical protein